MEVKWGIHKKGEANGGFATNRQSKTMSVLIQGNFQLTFKKEDGKPENIKLTRPGDFALWDFGVPHNWVALEDTTILTVRWPSIPKDQGPVTPVSSDQAPGTRYHASLKEAPAKALAPKRAPRRGTKKVAPLGEVADRHEPQHV